MILKKDYTAFSVLQEKNNQYLLCIGDKKYRTKPIISEIPFSKPCEIEYSNAAQDIIKTVILYIKLSGLDEMPFNLDSYKNEIQTILEFRKHVFFSPKEFEIKRKIIIDVFSINKEKYRLLHCLAKRKSKNLEQNF